MPTNELQIHETNLELSQSVPPEVAVGTEIDVKVKVWCPVRLRLAGGLRHCQSRGRDCGDR